MNNRGDIKTIQRFCLPALAKDFEQRILARPSDLQIVWTFDEKRCSASVVSHRVAALGEENPNTAYRQAVIRLRSKQSLVTKKSSVSESQSQEKTVVEYIVLQKRIVSGNEDDDWKVQGFAEESTPEKMEEDAEYWRQTLAAQVNTMG